MIESHSGVGSMLRCEDNLKRITLSEFEKAEGEEGFQFEMVDGVLHVTPSPDQNHQELVLALVRLLDARGPTGQRYFAGLLTDPRIYIDESEDHATVPQPDLAAYEKYPPKPARSYRELQPTLIVEIASPLGRRKDLIRDVALYARVPTVLEYWVLDPLRNPARPALTVFSRVPEQTEFTRSDYPPGSVYESARWPGLRIDLARIAID